MGLMPPQDSMFMLAESREQPMHVGSLQLFDLPKDAGPDWLAQLYAQVVAVPDVAPLFRKRPHRSPLTAGQWTWQDDGRVDLEHHVRHSALASPGRYRELFALTSRLHGTLLDRHRPLWETHLIEGLQGDQFAVYTKLHHAMMDGVSGLKLLQRVLSEDPEDRDVAVPWAPRAKPPRTKKEAGTGLLALPRDAASGVLGLAGDLVGLAPRVVKLAADAVRGQEATLPMQAPRSMLNVSITGSRRFAAETWPMERLTAVGRASGCTLNDVVLAQCSGALRAYLSDLDALPSSSLVAMTPVSLRDRGEIGEEETSNAVGTILCRLGTDLPDAGARLATVHASMKAGKAALAGLSQNQVSALSAVVMAPLLLNELISLHSFANPPFNLVISNVPGPTSPLYWNGARMRGLYPLSIPSHGLALNITLTSYADEVHFGLVGCRRSVPRLQLLLMHLEEALVDLEKAVA